MENVRIEVSNYRQQDRGAWKGTFSVVIYPVGIRINDCKYFVHGNNRWFKFPDRQYQKQGEDKPSYFPYCKLVEPEYEKLIEKQVIEQLKQHEGGGNVSERSFYAPKQSEMPF